MGHLSIRHTLKPNKAEEDIDNARKRERQNEGPTHKKSRGELSFVINLFAPFLSPSLLIRASG